MFRQSVTLVTLCADTPPLLGTYACTCISVISIWIRVQNQNRIVWYTSVICIECLRDAIQQQIDDYRQTVLYRQRSTHSQPQISECRGRICIRNLGTLEAAVVAEAAWQRGQAVRSYGRCTICYSRMCTSPRIGPSYSARIYLRTPRCYTSIN